MQQMNEGRAAGGAGVKPTRLSYKFQRLRERIRTAILNGEFQDRLPGERELGKLFNANAKTINKALCDLSGEGLLVRQIGRGTFVASPNQTQAAQHSLRITSFMPEPGAETYLQKRIYDALRNEAAAQGHAMQRAAYDERGDVSLTDWPSQMRRATDGIVCIPGSPLSGHCGHASEALLMEAHRRRVQIVVLGACAAESKLNAVVPDFVDAGFRLSEHLYRLGCDTVVAVHGYMGREVEAVISGCRTAAGRYAGAVRTCPLRTQADGVPTAACIDACFNEAAATRDTAQLGPTVGIVLVGLEALRFAKTNDKLMKRWRAGEIAITTVLDAGDSVASEMEMTSYEVPVDRIAAWGLKLLGEVAPGQRPVEVVIPGVLKVRNSISPEAPAATAPGHREAKAQTSPSKNGVREIAI